MKTIILAIAMATSAAAHAQDTWASPDKPKHFLGSALISAAAVTAGMSERNAFLLSAGIGLAKEVADSRRGGSGFSGRDLAWDLAGAYVGAKLGGVVIRRGFVGYQWSL